jgi:hypothetical protein
MFVSCVNLDLQRHISCCVSSLLQINGAGCIYHAWSDHVVYYPVVNLHISSRFTNFVEERS